MTAGDLLPAMVVIVLAVAGPALTVHRPDPCTASDAPQFRCWLDRHPDAAYDPIPMPGDRMEPLFNPRRDESATPCSHSRSGGS